MNLQELKSLGREMARTKGRGGSIFLIGLTLFAIGLVLGVGAASATTIFGWNQDLAKEVANHISSLIEIIVSAMFIPIFIGWAKKEELGYRDFWAMFTKKSTRKVIVAMILIGVGAVGLIAAAAVLAGMSSALVAFPLAMPIFVGIFIAVAVIIATILTIRFSFVSQAIVDKNIGVIDGFKYSWKITKGHFWSLIWFHLYFLLWNILGLLCLIIGMLWTATMRNIAFSKLYLELSEQAEKAE